MADEAAVAAEIPFPIAGTVPKDETNASSFLAENPEFDGRGTIIAILDTGVDPGAAGLQVTSDGRPKVIDLVECSGSGDVDTATVRKADADGTVEGLCGRRLKLNPEWKNPSGEWRVGRKAAFELASSQLLRRWKSERSKAASKEREQAVARLAAKAEELRVSKAKKEAIADAEAAVKALTERVLGDDLGPVFDCVVFHDGDAWRAAIDETETGDFSAAPAFTNYRVAREYGTITREKATLNYALNIYDDGATLSIVTDAGSHGTHVASIAAANHPDNAAVNGVAPGAQIVGIKIGDTRLGSMETCVGLARAMKAIVDNGCDLVNMSYGEPTTLPNAGRFVDLARELVYDKGVIFISSAGNAGPCLSTVGAPGGTSTCIIGVGALVSPLMARAEYSLCNSSARQNYTWSSRGPAVDGALGVCISAPGGAITSVPNWTLRRSQLMNGTSMSSPNACGNVALMLSGLKALNLPYAPHSIRRALENSSLPLAGTGVFGLGQGLLQVDGAFALAKSFATSDKPQLVVSTTVNGVRGRGVYLRNPADSAAPLDVSVSVSPKFHEDATPEERLRFDMRITLLTTATWVTAPAHMDMNGMRAFTMNVDPTALQAGAHYAEVRGYDSDNTAGGPVFRVPITVIRPLPERGAEAFRFNELVFRPGNVHRMFFSVPEGATWVDVQLQRNVDVEDTGDGTVMDAPDASPRLMVLHLLQVVPQTNSKGTNIEKYIRMRPHQRAVYSMAVAADQTLEVAVAEYWSMQAGCSVSLRVQFRGVLPLSRELTIHGSTGVARSDVRAVLQDAVVAPAGKLTDHVQVLHPKAAVVRPAKARDATTKGRPVFELEATYSLTQAASGKLSLKCAAVHDLLYESPWGSGLVIVSDKFNRLVGTSEAFPETLNLPAGTYTVRVQVKHERSELLTRLKTMQLSVTRKLSSPVSLKVYGSVPDAATGGSSLGTKALVRGATLPVYFAVDPATKLPKGVKPGEVLTGLVHYLKPDSNAEGPDKHPDGFPVTFIVPPSAPGGGDGSKKKKEDGATEAERAEAAVRDLRVKRLAGIKSDEEFAAALAGLQEWVDKQHVPLLRAVLHRADAKWASAPAPKEVGAAADAVIAAVDMDDVSKVLAVRVPANDEAAKKAKDEATAKREAAVDALHRKARSLAGLLGARSAGEKPAATDGAEESKGAAGSGDAAVAPAPASGAGAGAGAGAEAAADDDGFAAAAAALEKWADVAKAHPLVAVESHIRKGEFGSALAVVNEWLKKGEGEAEKHFPWRKWLALRVALWEKLGVPSEADLDRAAIVSRFAPSLPPTS